jgi:hypothetical protein
MNKTNIPEHELDNLLKQTFQDDLAPETAARMNRRFLNLKQGLDQLEEPAEQDTRRLWVRQAFRKEFLAFASAVMLILGGVLHLTGNQSALANSISRLQVIATVTDGLYSMTSMDCTLIIPAADGKNSTYRMRWNASGITRIDVDPSNGSDQTLWISNTAVPPDPVWLPAMEFLTPAILAQHIEKQHGLMQAAQTNDSGPDELLLVGRASRQVIEIAVDEKTYLPTTLKKYLPDPGQTDRDRKSLMKVQFLWNQPVSQELFVPGS